MMLYKSTWPAKVLGDRTVQLETVHFMKLRSNRLSSMLKILQLCKVSSNIVPEKTCLVVQSEKDALGSNPSGRKNPIDNLKQILMA